MKFLFKLFCFGILLFAPNFVAGQITLTLNSLPNSTPIDEAIYIAGNFNNWNPCDSNFKLIKQGSIYRITLKADTGEIEYKFTRGSWSKVECGVNGNSISNRSFKYSKKIGLNQSIAAWKDLLGWAMDTVSTALSNVHVLSKEFYMPQLNRTRRIWVYLPTDYEDAVTKRYSVLYMQDGQNLFDDKSSFSGEWGIDETLNKLTKLGTESCIVVGIENGGSNRINEYSPFVNKEYGGGEGKAYMRFIIETLKPYIDSAFRTHPDQKHTAIAGSSLGGLISIYGALSYPSVFGKVGAFSPALWFSDSIFSYAKGKYFDPSILIYYVAGSNESNRMTADIYHLDSILGSKGALSYVSNIHIKADGEHKEWFWRREFEEFYKILFFDVSDDNLKQFHGRLERNTKLVPNPASDYTEITSWPINTIQVLNDNGTSIFEAKVNSGKYKLDVSNYPNGIYYVVLDFGNTKVTKTLEISRK